jgi:hypothetical protein
MNRMGIVALFALAACSSSKSKTDAGAEMDQSVPLDFALASDLSNGDDLEEAPDLFTPEPNYMFASSVTYVAGSLGGLAGADASCSSLAAAAHLPGTYVALLATEGAGGVTAGSRLGNARGWIRVDGKPFADTVASIFTNNAEFYTPNIDENGVSITTVTNPGVETITGTEAGGAAYTGFTCSNYTTTTGSLGIGEADATGFHWVAQGVGSCSAPYRLYCFGIDRQVPVTVQKQTGRIAFVSTNAYIPTGGQAGADAQCASDASTNSLPGTYRALIATNTVSATDSTRFNTGAGAMPWVRVDGVPVFAKASDLPTGVIAAPLNQTAAGTYVDYSTWTGAASLTAPGTNTTTCTNWTSNTTGTGDRGDAEYTTYFFVDGADPCTTITVHVYCLQT